MTNADLATELVINYFESEHIMVTTPQVNKKIKEWETKLDPIDFISLAAIVIEDPNKFELSETEIRKIRNFYFPS